MLTLDVGNNQNFHLINILWDLGELLIALFTSKHFFSVKRISKIHDFPMLLLDS